MLGSHPPGNMLVYFQKSGNGTYSWVKWTVEINPIGRGIVTICELNGSHFTNDNPSGIYESLQCGAGGVSRRI